MPGIKHTIACRCILTQFRNRKNPPVHQFVVFSEIKDDDSILSTHVSCNNCGIIHKITDLCKSEIIENSEDSPVVTKSDVRISINTDVREILDSYDVDLPTYQYARWIMESESWGEQIILTKKELEDRVEGKYLVFKGPGQYRINTFLEDLNEVGY